MLNNIAVTVSDNDGKIYYINHASKSKMEDFNNSLSEAKFAIHRAIYYIAYKEFPFINDEKIKALHTVISMLDGIEAKSNDEILMLSDKADNVHYYEVTCYYDEHHSLVCYIQTTVDRRKYEDPHLFLNAVTEKCGYTDITFGNFVTIKEIDGVEYLTKRLK